MGAPQLHAYPSLVLPELRAIMHPVPKCASTDLISFFTQGKHPLFRAADSERDGVGAKYQHFVKDLGETEVSRRMKRDFFSFSFVCHPLKRVVSAYGTINQRTTSGHLVLNGHDPAFLWVPFASISRSREPQRFQQFIEDLSELQLPTLELAPYVTPSMDSALADSALAGASATARHARRACAGCPSFDDLKRARLPHRLLRLFSTKRARLEPLSSVPPTKNTSDVQKLRWFGSKFERLSASYSRGEARAVYEVENDLNGNWGHARSQRFLLGVTDSDGLPRRIDWIGPSHNQNELKPLCSPSGSSAGDLTSRLLARS